MAHCPPNLKQAPNVAPFNPDKLQTNSKQNPETKDTTPSFRYLEDRRPASNIDPYIVTALIFDTTCLKGDTKAFDNKATKLL